jgi:Tfp pilus assembly protein FimT
MRPSVHAGYEMRRITGHRGFTLIELVLIILITVILVFAMIPRFDLSGNRAASAARKLVSDLRYAQQLANATQVRNGVIFNSATQYMVFTSNDSSIPATDPLKGGSYIVNMAGDYAGVTLSNSLTSGIVRFDSLGTPYEGTNGSQTALAAARTITVSAGGSIVRTITIQPNTGSIQ